MARVKSRGEEKPQQPIDLPGQPGSQLILQPGRDQVQVTTAQRRVLPKLGYLGWRLFRARQREKAAGKQVEKIRDQMLELQTQLPEGVVGVVANGGSHSHIKVEFVLNRGRRVTDSLGLLRVLSRKKLNLVKAVSIDASILLDNPQKLPMVIAALNQVLGEEAVKQLFVLELDWTGFDEAVEAKALPKSVLSMIGDAIKQTTRVDAKPVS